MEFHHISVLLNECIDNLNITPDGIYVDGTMGGGGHSLEIAKRLTTGRLICIDQDPNAHEAAGKRLAEYKDRITFVRDNFGNIANILDSLGIEKIDGMLLDIGVSSHQLDEAERGFSYQQDAPLDMRMNPDRPFSAYDVVNGYDEDELDRVIFTYGEERWARRIAQFIVKEREAKPIETTGELVDIIKKAVPKGARKDGPHPAKRTFQAIRIEVNGELEVLQRAIDDVAARLAVGGRLCIITFHSLEDRIVKEAFRKQENPCICPPRLRQKAFGQGDYQKAHFTEQGRIRGKSSFQKRKAACAGGGFAGLINIEKTRERRGKDGSKRREEQKTQPERFLLYLRQCGV